MDFKAYIFDLDGTLLDTLPDLVRLTNMVLEAQGWPPRSSEQILSYIGDGGRMLLKRAAPPDASDDQLDEGFEEWERLYPDFGHAMTKPFPGIPELLASLRAQGAKLGVLSNKVHSATQEVIATHFPNVFDVVRGEGPDTPRKPDPTGLRNILRTMGVTPSEAAYVGDAPTDMEVARLVGTFAIGVSWGYQPESAIEAAGAQLIIHEPHQLP